MRAANRFIVIALMAALIVANVVMWQTRRQLERSTATIRAQTRQLTETLDLVKATQDHNDRLLEVIQEANATSREALDARDACLRGRGR